MKTDDTPLYPAHYYHIYNRGNNGENIFYETKNYRYFLEKWAKYIEPVAESYAYCLLRNHFHFLVRIRDEALILETIKANYPALKAAKIQENLPRHISYQFGHFFNSYAQSMNKGYNRTGCFFEERFERIWIDTENYFDNLISYIHHNPQKHGFVADFRDYPHSSYNAHLSLKHTLLKRESVLTWFGGGNEYVGFHQKTPDEELIKPWIIEKD